MSVDPTVYDLQQDERISTIEGYVSPDFPVPDGPEYSYPVVGQAMSDLMWQYVTLGLGDGVLDEGGQPYWLRGRENAGNTLRITVSTTTGTAQALLRGFYHRMTEDRTFTLDPGVSVETTYHFCLTYSPVGLGTADGPITLQMYAGEPPTTQGRFHIVLWKLTRKPNQLLTDATVQRVRPKITPMITVDTEADRPKANTVLWGTRCVVTETMQEWRAGGATEDGPRDWYEMKNAVVRPDTTFYKWGGQGGRPTATRVGPMVILEGRVVRTNGADFYASSTEGYLIHELPATHRPASERRFITKGPGINSAEKSATIIVSTNGQVRAYPHANNSWVSMDGCCFTVWGS